MERTVRLSPDLPEVCRLGLATRGNTRLTEADVRLALRHGIHYLNWCGHPDGLSKAFADLPPSARHQVVLACQFSARTRRKARDELGELLRTLRTDYIDVLTFYYVESPREWEQIIGKGGAFEYLQEARQEGKVRLLGLTTHQRRLAARWARSGRLELLMIRYNAAHRAAERQVFPVTRAQGIPVVAFTCLRWKTLLRPTPENPPGQAPPQALEWYRFVLAQPDIAVALMAPNDRRELQANLRLLEDWRPPDAQTCRWLKAQGDRVRRFGEAFP